MQAQTFLQHVLPSTGMLCLAGIKHGRVRHVFLSDRSKADGIIDALLDDEWNVYFGCASYKTDENRTQDNVDALKALYLDIDCGAGKPYATQSEAINALRGFCRTYSLPRPTLVDSGRGVHVYWTFTEPVDAQEWKPVASRLKALCAVHGLGIDPVVTTDEARILRVPGTKNFKGEEGPLDVQLIFSGDSTTFDELKALLEAADVPASAVEVKESLRPAYLDKTQELDETTKALLGNRRARYRKLLNRSRDGSGCNQVIFALEHSEELPEPLWRSNLSIAQHCVDRDQAIHFISKDHPEYDPEETERKAAAIPGPHHCKTFEANNPLSCKDCKHYGKLTSPIQLAYEIAKSEGPVEIEVEAENGVAQASVVIPEYPFPYFRGRNGGVYRRPDVEDKKKKKDEDEDEDEDDKEILVCPVDFYAVKRLNDPELGDVVWFRLHLPKDGIRNFSMPAAHLGSKDKLREFLASRGLSVINKQVDLVMAYVNRWVHTLQNKERAERTVTQFGWAEDDTKFIVGEREISGTGVRYVPPASELRKLSDDLQKKGSLEAWKDIIKFYNRPGMEAQVFALGVAFGSPLLKFTGVLGAIVNLYSPTSGTGKSTLLRVVNSVYGRPNGLMLLKDDTRMSRQFQTGALNNIPCTVDEITNMSAEDMSDLCYNTTNGRGRNRMHSQTNSMRINNTTWASIALTSSNASIREKISSFKLFAEGELMRVLEIPISRDDAITKEESDRVFSKLDSNYGHAIDPYMFWVINNFDRVIEGLEDMRARIDRDAHLTQRERFWSAVGTSVFVGLGIAKRLELIDVNIKAAYDWFISYLLKLKADTYRAGSGVDPENTLGEFINSEIANTLIIDDAVDLRLGFAKPPVLEPRGQLNIRIEPDTQKMFVLAKTLKAYCTKYQIPYMELCNKLEKMNILTGKAKRRLGKGSKFQSIPTECLVFDLRDSSLKDISSFLESTYANSGSGVQT